MGGGGQSKSLLQTFITHTGQKCGRIGLNIKLADRGAEMLGVKNFSGGGYLFLSR